MSNSQKFYITTSIAYVNASPHIGFAMEVLQADVLARYNRLLGKDVFFLSGTDENGLKIKKTAEESKMHPKEFVDINSAKFQLLLDELNISNNDFIRTTDKIHHWTGAQKMWKMLVSSGDIYRGIYEGRYCVGCEAYLTEKDLVDGKCPSHLKEPYKIKERNYFFRLSKYSEKIRKKIESNELEIIPNSRKNEILNILKDGLRDISFSRSSEILDWGIPVPDDSSQTMYVWCDALTNYISALGYGNNFEAYGCGSDKNKNLKKFQKYWPADVHIIGKDILRFHAAVWPAMLLSAGISLPKKIFVHGFITSEGKKMSKSLGNVVDPFEVVHKYGVDSLRYYLLKEIPSGEDGDFSFLRFEEVYKADLADGIGNLVSRALGITEKITLGKIPFIDNNLHCADSSQCVNTAKINKEFQNLKSAISKQYEIQFELFNSFEFNVILEGIKDLIGKCDRYIEIHKIYKPSEILKNDKNKINFVLYSLLESIRHISWMIFPFMPNTSEKILRQLGIDSYKEKNKKFEEIKKWGGLISGTDIKKEENLFPRI